MKTQFVYDNVTVYINNVDEKNIKERLDPKVYSVTTTPQGSYILKILKDDFKLPSKIYGDVESKVSRIIKTYDSRSDALGVLLTGIKGSGKTLLIKKLSQTFINNKKLPVILITESYIGDGFLNFINSLGECVLVFDEFGKTYKNEEQSQLLSLFDGVNSTKKRLILLSENSKWNVNSYFIGRPSRIYYHYHYNSIGREVIQDYCKDRNVPDTIIQDILKTFHSIEDFNFDILQTIIDEYNIHQDENVYKMLSHLNIDFKSDFGKVLKLTKIIMKEDKKEREIKFKEKMKFIPHFINKAEDLYLESYIEIVDEIDTIIHDTILHGYITRKMIIDTQGTKYALKLPRNIIVVFEEIEITTSPATYFRGVY